MIQYSFKIEAKAMETSDSMAWEFKLFTHEFLGFRAKKIWKLNYRGINHMSSLT